MNSDDTCFTAETKQIPYDVMESVLKYVICDTKLRCKILACFVGTQLVTGGNGEGEKYGRLYGVLSDYLKHSERDLRG